MGFEGAVRTSAGWGGVDLRWRGGLGAGRGAHTSSFQLRQVGMDPQGFRGWGAHPRGGGGGGPPGVGGLGAGRGAHTSSFQLRQANCVTVPSTPD